MPTDSGDSARFQTQDATQDATRKAFAEESLKTRKLQVAPTEGYYQTIKRVVPELKNEEASSIAHHTKEASDNRDVLRVGETLPLTDPQAMITAIARSAAKGHVEVAAQATAPTQESATPIAPRQPQESTTRVAPGQAPLSDRSSAPGIVPKKPQSAPGFWQSALGHTERTWSNVLHGKASTSEYVEAGVEVAGGIALFSMGYKVSGLLRSSAAAEETTLVGDANMVTHDLRPTYSFDASGSMASADLNHLATGYVGETQRAAEEINREAQRAAVEIIRNPKLEALLSAIRDPSPANEIPGLNESGTAKSLVTASASGTEAVSGGLKSESITASVTGKPKSDLFGFSDKPSYEPLVRRRDPFDFDRGFSSGRDKTRLDLTDSPMSAAMKFSEGNPGALTALMNIITDAEKIDPQGALGGFGPLMTLDMEGIYGSRIWMLYKDVAGEDTLNTMAILRGKQLGIITKDALNTAIENRGRGLDVADILRQVQDKLPEFGRS